MKGNLIILLIVLCLMGWTPGPVLDKEQFFSQEKLDYTGTNSLFVELGDKMKFHWITGEEDTGVYELRTADGKTLESGETNVSRVHSVALDRKLSRDLVFYFGGKSGGKFEIALRKPERDLKANYRNVDSVFVVGDVHGHYHALINLLQKSGIIDENLSWIAGTSHLVFLGDLFDRGDDVTRVLWFIYGLERQAEQAKGKVHLVLGNHEIMVMSKDLRYVSRKEQNIAVGHKVSYDKLFHPQNSLLGLWLSGKPSVLKIDQYLFAHGGITDLGTSSLEKFNMTAAAFMEDPIFLEITQKQPDSVRYDPERWHLVRDFFFYSNGPYWYRGYVNSDTLEVQLKQMLATYRSKVHVVAHTRMETITQKYGGSLLTTDLYEEATQLLFLKKEGEDYHPFKIDSLGRISELD